MSSSQTKLFTSNKSQAVRLSKAVALPESVTVVDVVAIGNTRIITPAGESWAVWFDGQGVSDDFMESRDQPVDQLRESLG